MTCTTSVQRHQEEEDRINHLREGCLNRKMVDTPFSTRSPATPDRREFTYG
jgi:hypothetical protein